VDSELKSAGQHLQSLVHRNRSGESIGVYAVCSAQPSVIEAAVQQALEGGSVLHVESTSSQVNQFGGYSGKTPAQFAAFVHAMASRAGLSSERVLLGGDHLGPYPWKDEPSDIALHKGCELVRACVLAGYTKIHLDASMPCADDAKVGLAESTVARRAAILCRAAETALNELPAGSDPILYVVGTEVPAPGGETQAGEPPAVTSAETVGQTLDVFRAAFNALGLNSAWERVIGLVVQPGVEFGDDVIFNYDRQKAMALSAILPQSPALAYEAHSTDYQPPIALRQMVEDHFAILKVGPWLTFAFREAVFALSAIEQEWLAQKKDVRLSQVRDALEAAMLRNPVYWRSYYRGDENEVRLARFYSYSDRCRYYWGDAAVQRELSQLKANLDGCPQPLTLISQYLPVQYEAIRSGRLLARAEDMIQEHIRKVLRSYAVACGHSAKG
jgi:D-tagatose-1,6-bisphosphate aldolase subunit GatZ/KbaZ